MKQKAKRKVLREEKGRGKEGKWRSGRKRGRKAEERVEKRKARRERGERRWEERHQYVYSCIGKYLYIVTCW